MGGLNEDQAMLAEMSQRFATSIIEQGDSAPNGPRLRAELAEMGWMGILVPEHHGGVGGSPLDMFLLAQAHGQGLPDTPFFATGVLGVSLLGAADNRAMTDTWLPAITAGERTIALAHQEHPHVVEPEDIGSTAIAESGGFRLSGVKAVVPDAGGADAYLFTARVRGGSNSGGLMVFHLPAATPGLHLERLTLVDQRGAASLRLNDIYVPEQAALFWQDATEAVRRCLLLGQVALVGEAVGATEKAFEMAVTYVKERRQFGRPLASFQVIRHRVADMYMMLEELRAIGLGAARACAQDIGASSDIVRAAKVHLGTAGVWVVEQAVQLHGAMGITVELAVGRILQRIMVLDGLLGNSEHHTEMIAKGYRRTVPGVNSRARSHLDSEAERHAAVA